MKFVFLITFTVLSIVGFSQTTKTKNSNQEQFKGEKKAAFVKSEKMDKDEFWKIVEHAIKNSQDDPELKSKIIMQSLLNYSTDQIIEFEIIFRKLVIEANDFKVMAAQKIIQGWVTDDSYLYFRCWLIGQGYDIFYETLKNPDYLADKVSKGVNSDFEDLMYVATEAFMQKTGDKEETENFPRSIALNKGLDYDFGAPPTKGTDWQSSQLPGLYPKLWKKFH